jgi:hypothetical protein
MNKIRGPECGINILDPEHCCKVISMITSIVIVTLKRNMKIIVSFVINSV